MKELGHKRVTIWLSPNELAAVKAKASEVGKRTATYCREAVLMEAGFRHAWQ